MTDKATTLPDFNPSGSTVVKVIKEDIEAMIQFVREIDGDPRCKSLAITKLEEASMWAVKSMFIA